MAHWEHQLLTRIIKTGDINTPIKWGITYEDFLSSEYRAMYQHLLAYFQMTGTSGSVLGPSSIRNVYPTFELIDDPAVTTEALCTEVRHSRIRTEMRQQMISLDAQLDADPQGAVTKLAALTNYIQSLGAARRTDVFADEAMARIMQQYTLIESGVDLSVCSWPWQPMQEATRGIYKDDYIVLYGRPKSMKSWVLASLIAHAFSQGKRILIYTKEMTADNILQRVIAIMARVRYHEFRVGQLEYNEKEALGSVWATLNNLRALQPLICLSGKDAGDQGDTVPWLRSKIEEHQPHMCFIDGMYLMHDCRGSARQKDNARVQNISRDLRQTVLDTNVPIACTIQANREAAKNDEAHLHEMAFSDAIGQDATIAMRVIREVGQPRLILKIAGSREFQLDGFCIHGVPATNFGDAGKLDSNQLQRALANDAEETDEKEVKKTYKKRAKKANGHKQLDTVEPSVSSTLDEIMADVYRSFSS